MPPNEENNNSRTFSFRAPSYYDEQPSSQQAKASSRSSRKKTTHKRAAAKPKKGHHELVVKVNPFKIVKGAVIVLLLIGVFMLGRISVPSADDGKSIGSSISGFAVKAFGSANQVETGEPETQAQQEVESEPAQEEPAPEPQAEQVAQEPEPVEQEPEQQEVEEEPAPEAEEEPIVTTYDFVSLDVTKVHIDWKETWGKITGFDYKITNNEAGTIRADHFKVFVEGYEDEEEFPITDGPLEVRSSMMQEAEIAVPGGFPYNEASTGDLQTVQLKIFLYDSADRLIGSVIEDFNLKG